MRRTFPAPMRPARRASSLTARLMSPRRRRRPAMVRQPRPRPAARPWCSRALLDKSATAQRDATIFRCEPCHLSQRLDSLCLGFGQLLRLVWLRF